MIEIKKNIQNKKKSDDKENYIKKKASLTKTEMVQMYTLDELLTRLELCRIQRVRLLSTVRQKNQGGKCQEAAEKQVSQSNVRLG